MKLDENALVPLGGYESARSWVQMKLQEFARAINRRSIEYEGGVTDIRQYGVINNDGTTDDSATFQAAAASGDPCIDARGLNCKIAGQINIPSGQVWLLQGTTLTIASSTLTVFAATNVDNWALVGPFKIVGDGSTSGTAKGVSVSGGANWRVRDYTAETIKGWGFYYVPGASAMPANHGYVSNFRAISCYRGWEDTAGTGAEYSTLESPYIRGCTEGLITAAGDTIVLGGQLLENGTNVILNSGANHGHGAFIGTNINHGTTYNIRANSVLNGHDFIGCHIYGNSAGSSSGAIFLDTSRGIRIRGGIWDCHVYNYKGGSSALNWIQDMYCPGDYGIARQVGGSDGHDQLIITGCSGPGSYQGIGGKEAAGTPLNDPSMCYAIAQRDAGSTQSLTSGVAATLTFSATPPFPDRRGFANMGTGAFTVPASQAGLYRITVDLIFGGTSMTAASSFLEFKIGGTTKKLLASTAYSTTKVLIAGSFDYNLAVSDAVTFDATIVGTSPAFGDSTLPSSVTINRIA